MFFQHPLITHALDEAEAEFFDRLSSSSPSSSSSSVAAAAASASGGGGMNGKEEKLMFDVTKGFKALAELISMRDMKVDGVETSTTDNMEEITTMMKSTKNHWRFIRFLGKMGVEVKDESEQPFEWRWKSEMEEFVETMFVSVMRNLTNDGRGVNVGMMERLFPKLTAMQDSRVDNRLPEVVENVTENAFGKRRKKKKQQHGCDDGDDDDDGRMNEKSKKRIDRIVMMLDSLTEERKTLLSSMMMSNVSSSSSATGKMMNCEEKEEESGGTMKAVTESRRRRLKEIESLTETLRDEFHSLTAVADEKGDDDAIIAAPKPKKKKKKKKPPQQQQQEDDEVKEKEEEEEMSSLTEKLKHTTITSPK